MTGRMFMINGSPINFHAGQGHQNYEVLGVFSIEEVLPYVVFKGKKFHREYIYEGRAYNVKMVSDRLKTFSNNRKCVCCGLEGSFFLLERTKGTAQPQNPHFNMYGVDLDGKAILFTRDHIKPLSHGGFDGIENLQTMCYTCNQFKGAFHLPVAGLRELGEVLNKWKKVQLMNDILDSLENAEHP